MAPEELRRVSEEKHKRTERLSPRVFIVGLFTGSVAGVGGFGYREYRLYTLRQKLGEAIGRDLGLTATILKLRVDSGKITFGEALALCNRSIEDRTNLIIELRGLYPDLDYNFKTKLIDYLSAENEFVRATREYYEKAIERNTAENEHKEFQKEIDRDIARRLISHANLDSLDDRVDQDTEMRIKALHDEDQSANEFLAMYDKMEKLEQLMVSDAHAAGLQFDKVFQENDASTLPLRKRMKK